MKLHLNLSTTPPVNKRPFLAGATAIGTVSFLALVILFHAAYHSWRASKELRAEISRLQDQIRAENAGRQELESYFRTPAAQEVLDRSAFLNSLIGERSFPWTKIFMDLEKTIPPGVHVVSISPVLVNGRAKVMLQIAATSDEAEISFLKALGTSAVFSDPVPKDVQHDNRAGSADKVIVNLTVWYSTT